MLVSNIPLPHLLSSWDSRCVPPLPLREILNLCHLVPSPVITEALWACFPSECRVACAHSLPHSKVPSLQVPYSFSLDVPLFKTFRKCLGPATCPADLVFWFPLHRFLAVALRAALVVCTTFMLWKQTLFLPSSVRMYE